MNNTTRRLLAHLLQASTNTRRKHLEHPNSAFRVVHEYRSRALRRWQKRTPRLRGHWSPPPTTGVDGNKALSGPTAVGLGRRDWQLLCLQSWCTKCGQRSTNASHPSQPPPQSSGSLWPTKTSTLIEDGVSVIGQTDGDAESAPQNVRADEAIAWHLYKMAVQRAMEEEKGIGRQVIVSLRIDRLMTVRMSQVAACLRGRVRVIPQWVAKERKGEEPMWLAHVGSLLKALKQGDDLARLNAWSRFVVSAAA